MLELYTYKAGKGDCIRLHFADDRNIYIDSGVTSFATDFRSICQEQTSYDLLILTHTDEDHIGGILTLLRSGWKCPFKVVRMNKSGSAGTGNAYLSSQQNDEVYSRLLAQGITIRSMLAGDVIEENGAIITTILPERILIDKNRSNALLSYRSDYGKSLSKLACDPIVSTDRSISNRNSIVFIFEFEGKRLLFTGDAWAADIISALGNDKHFFDLVKLPHHGAAGNISEAFPDHIQSDSFLICTDGRMHPDKQTIAKLIKWYGFCTIYSPSKWWNSGFFTDSDDQCSINLIQKEGLVVSW